MEWKSNIFQFSGSTSAIFQCSWGVIPKSFICNGINNCGDNSDEENCENFVKTSTVIPLAKQPAISTTPISSKAFMLVYHSEAHATAGRGVGRVNLAERTRSAFTKN